MPVHAEKRVLPFSPEQLFDLVADIESYPEFLPWCAAARVRDREGDVLYADMVIGYRMIRDRFTSRVTMTAPGAGEAGVWRIDVFYIDGPLKYLQNHWVFRPADGGCEIDFFVDFQFRSRLFERLIAPLFNEVVRRMVGAFEGRAHIVYTPHQADAREPKEERLAPAGARLP